MLKLYMGSINSDNCVKIKSFTDKSKKIFDVVYLTALVLYVACYACNKTAAAFPFLNVIFGISSFCLMLVAVYRLISVMLGNKDKLLYSIVIGIAAILLMALYVFSLINGEHSFITIVPFALIGAMGMNADHVLYAGICGNVLLILFNACNTLFTENGLSYSEMTVRDFFYLGDNGFYVSQFNCYSCTDLAAHYFWIIAAYLWIRGRKITWLELLSLGALDIFVYSITGSNTSLLAISMVLLFAFVLRFVVAFNMLPSKENGSGDGIFRGRLVSVLSFLARYSFVIIATICICLAACYNTGSPIMFRLNQILHNRISYGFRGLMEYGVHFVAEDNPTVAMCSSADGFYFYLDCSYLSLLIRYGILFLVVYLAGMTFIQMKYKKYIYGALILSVCALSCIEEPHLNELPYNFFILLLLADKNVDSKLTVVNTEPKKNRVKILKVCSIALTVSLLVGAICINSPRFKAVKKLDSLDEKAAQIYERVQVNIELAQYTGEWDELISSSDSYEFGYVLSKPSDYSEVTGMSWETAVSSPKEHSYYYVTYEAGGDNAAIVDLLLSGEIKDLVGDGSLVIEYDLASGKVYSIWYSESSGCTAIEDGRDYTRSERLRSDVIPTGYYAGGVNG